MYSVCSMNVGETHMPAQFECPISLELMNDPVTLPTGQTFDRRSIQRWFRTGKKTCPTTRQELRTHDLIPNLTLQNCIRGWQLNNNNAASGPKVPTSPRLLTDYHVKRMLDDIKAGTDRVETLKLLTTMAKSTEKNRKMIVDGGALPLLGSILSSHTAACASNQDCRDSEACEEALGVMAALSNNEDVKLSVGQAVGVKNLSTLSFFLQKGSLDAKVSAIVVLECLVMDDEYLPEVAVVDGLLPGIVGILKENSDMVPRGLTTSLRALYAICLPRKNRTTVIEAGAVEAVLELLPGAKRGVMEGAMAILDLLSRCSQGKEALCDHALTIPVVVRSLVLQSSTVTEHAVKVLHSMLMFTANPVVHALAVKYGAIKKLLLVIQSDIEQGSKQRAQELLKLLHCQNSSRGDPCISTIDSSLTR